MENTADISSTQQFLYPRVKFQERFIARLIDEGMTYLLMFLLPLVATLIPHELGMLVGVVLGLTFFLFRDGWNGGAGFGKAKQSILVIDIYTNKECSYFQSFLRNIMSEVSAVVLAQQLGGLQFFSFALGIVTLVDIWRVINADGGRRIGDMIARTQVVYWEDQLNYNINVKKEEKLLQQAVDKIKPAG